VPEFLEYDPFTGLRTDFSFNEESGDATIHYTSDVQAVVDHTRALANDGATDGGIKRGWWLYAKIPPVVQLQMRAKGINIHDRDSTNRMIAEINANYPHLKCTQKVDQGKKLIQVHDLGAKS